MLFFAPFPEEEVSDYDTYQQNKCRLFEFFRH